MLLNEVRRMIKEEGYPDTIVTSISAPEDWEHDKRMLTKDQVMQEVMTKYFGGDGKGEKATDPARIEAFKRWKEGKKSEQK